MATRYCSKGQTFLDSNGKPRSGGKINTFVSLTSTPQFTYSDDTLVTSNGATITLNSSGRSPVDIFLLAADYKITLTNSDGTDSITDDPVHGSDGTQFTSTASGAVAHPYSLTRMEEVNVFDFLTTAQIAQVQANGVTLNLSTNLQNAIAANKPLFWPAGTYACNLTLPNAYVMRGAGSALTVISPFAIGTAAFTYTYKSGSSNTYWNYHAYMEGIGFSSSGKTGVGFTCGKTTPSTYAAGDEYVGNMTFRNCAWIGFAKGFQAPYGNIRKQFIDCGWQSNQYGIYNLDAKYGGVMHAGCLYITGGEFNANDCAIYVNNQTDGYYTPQISGTLFEGNKCNGAFLNKNGIPLGPVVFDNIGCESNGTVTAANVTLDIWTGTVLTTESISTPIWLFDGNRSHGKFKCGGIIGGIRIRATNSVVEVTDDARVEHTTGFGGQSDSVDDPTTSRIVYGDFVCDEGGDFTGQGLMVIGRPTQDRNLIASSGSGSNGRSLIIPARTVISAAGGGMVGVGTSFNAQRNFAGGAAITGTVTANDGDLYANVNEYTATYSAVTTCAGTSKALSAGYWFWSIACVVKSGTIPNLKLWDESTYTLADFRIPAGGLWHTVGGIGYLASTTPTIFLDLTDTQSGSSTWRLACFQLWRFPTLIDAQNYMQSRVFSL